MARARKKTEVQTETPADEAAVANDQNDVFGEAIASAQQREEQNSAQTAVVDPPPAPVVESPSLNGNGQATQAREGNGHAATVRRKVNLPDKLGIPVGDVKVQLIDKGDNLAGIGIRVEFPEGAKNRPTAEEKEIIRRHVKGEEGEPPSGFTWKGDLGMWHKGIARPGERMEEIPANRAVAIRLDAERRVEVLAAALNEHQVDPVGYAERIRQDREQASEGIQR